MSAEVRIELLCFHDRLEKRGILVEPEIVHIPQLRMRHHEHARDFRIGIGMRNRLFEHAPAFDIKPRFHSEMVEEDEERVTEAESEERQSVERRAKLLFYEGNVVLAYARAAALP